MQLLGDRLVSWSSKRQKSAAMSSTKDEYIDRLWPWIQYVNTTQAVNTAHGVSTASIQVNAAYCTNIDNLSDAVICAFFASQPNRPQLIHEDLQQMHPDDMDEIDLRWQMAMLTMRARSPKWSATTVARGDIFLGSVELQEVKNKERSRRSVHVETSTSIDWVSCDGLGGYDWSDHAEEGLNYALMAFSSSRNFMPLTPDLSFTSLDEFVNKPVVENCKAMSSEEVPKVVRKYEDAPSIKE
nr:ribonuclease H-like domain-containing protein [Tanacetum cinerariifolium]